MPDDPVDVLRRWEDHGALWRVESLTDELAVVVMCTCYGEPVDRLESSDPALLAFVQGRGDSADALGALGQPMSDDTSEGRSDTGTTRS